MRSQQDGSTVSVYAQVKCQEPKTGQQKGSTLDQVWRNTLPIWVYYLSMVIGDKGEIFLLHTENEHSFGLVVVFMLLSDCY